MTKAKHGRTQDQSFYDSAYLQSAKKHELTLVTEDKRLSKRAVEVGVTCIQIDDLKHEP